MERVMDLQSERFLTVLLGSVAVLFVSAAAADRPRDTQRDAATSGVTYRLVEGSYLVDDCSVCERPTIMVPIRGSFTLTPTRPDPLFVDYALGAFRFASDSVPPSYSGWGSGSYRQGGEVALVEEMALTLRIGARTEILLSSGSVAPQARLPWIEIDLVEDPPANQLQFYRLHLVAVAWPEVWFSTRLPFSSRRREVHRVSDGDLLSSSGFVVRRGSALANRLRIFPPQPDLGLDAIVLAGPKEEGATRVSRPTVWFSLDSDAWSATLGELHHGDLLSDTGRVVRSFEELVGPFCPEPLVQDYGLDAVARAPDGTLLFSIERDFFSECSSIEISRSDLLAEDGSVFRRGSDLLARFHAGAGDREDVGLDAAHVFPDGEVWFSTERAFVDERYGLIGDGDLLSDTGRIVARNRELLAPFRPPVGNIDDFGLDALHVASSPADRAAP
jgi:hypothetical protein